MASARSDAPVSQPTRVLVTRPQPQADQWVDALCAQGIAAEALPLIDIGPAIDPAAVQQAWRQLADYTAVMFVSGHAVSQFFEQKPQDPSVEWSSDAITTVAWSTGPGTRQALLRCGLQPSQIVTPPIDAPQFDSEALWACVGAQVQPGQRVLIVRGSVAGGRGAGRDWLGEQLERAGARVQRLLAYQRSAPSWDGAQVALARAAAADGSWWLFSSSEAIDHLQQALPAQDWHAARALATHPRIAARARQAGFGVVCESRPTLPEVMASIKSCG